MDRKQTVVFIHGLGDSPSAWDYHIAALPDEFTGVAVEVPGVTSGGNGDGFSLDGAARGMVAELDRLGIERAHFVGLSLGAMLAFEVAASYPERISSLTLAAGQVKPPRALMAVQNAIMRFLPARFVAQGSASKEQMARGVAHRCHRRFHSTPRHDWGADPSTVRFERPCEPCCRTHVRYRYSRCGTTHH